MWPSSFFPTHSLGAPLSRAYEMLLGSVLPLFLLGTYEFYASFRNWHSIDYQKYCELKAKDFTQEAVSEEQNSFGFKVLAVTLFIVGILIVILGFIAEESMAIVLVIGVLILIASGFIHPAMRKRLAVKSTNQ